MEVRALGQRVERPGNLVSSAQESGQIRRGLGTQRVAGSQAGDRPPRALHRPVQVSVVAVSFELGELNLRESSQTERPVSRILRQRGCGRLSRGSGGIQIPGIAGEEVPRAQVEGEFRQPPRPAGIAWSARRHGLACRVDCGVQICGVARNLELSVHVVLEPDPPLRRLGALP